MHTPSPKKSRPEEPLRPPIEFHPRSNGEFEPWDPTPAEIAAEKRFFALADEKARRLGISRRDFIRSSAGMATALVVLNQSIGCRLYEVDEDHTLDPALASAAMAAGEFIFDGHTHHNNFRDMDQFVRQIFLQSDTTVACISVGQGAGTGPDDSQGAPDRIFTRELVNRVSAGKRVVLHGKVWPKRNNQSGLDQAQLYMMDEMASLWKVAAWKTYPHEANNWRLDDAQIGHPFIEKGRSVGVKIFAVHKGLGTSSPVDMPVAANSFPDCKFLCFHSGVDSDFTEGPYNPDNTRGMDRLIRTHLENDKPENLYADLGSVWNTYAVGAGANSNAAGHLLGKLLLHLGEDKILWGTDALVVGAPQPQIQAFRAFQIPESLQSQYGYPALTDAAKEKILGLNNAAIYGIDPAAALQDVTQSGLDAMREVVRAGEIPWVPFEGYGPVTRRDFFAMLRTPGHPALG